MKKAFKRVVVVVLMISISVLGLPTVAVAAPIGTEALIELDQRVELMSQIQGRLASDEVRAQLLAYGVSPTEVDARIAALSNEEMQLLAHRLDEQPAGGSVLAVIGVVFVVLLILELVGVTNIFTRV